MGTGYEEELNYYGQPGYASQPPPVYAQNNQVYAVPPPQGYPTAQPVYAQNQQHLGYAAPPPQVYAQPQPQVYAQPQPNYASPAPQVYAQNNPPAYMVDGPPPPYQPPAKANEMLIQPSSSVSPQFHDVWATILFLIHLGGIAVIAYFSLRTANDGTAFLSPQEQNALLYALFVAAGFATVAGYIYTYMMHKFAIPLIYLSGVLCILLFIFFAIYSFITVNIYSGIIWLVIAVIQTLFFLAFRNRIPFAALMLQTVIKILWSFPSTLFASFCVTVLQVAWTVFFIFVASYATGVWSGSALGGILLYCCFSYYWTSHVLKNVLHVTSSGLFATHYFFAGSGTFPANPVAASFRRAMTFSFGSICFGSLLVALIKTLRTVVRLVFGNSFLRYCLDCCLGIIEGTMRFINHYAFCEIAVYGKSFCNAGKDVMALLSRNGLDVIVNDDLIGNVVLVAIVAVAAASFGIGYGVFAAFAPLSSYRILVGVAGLFVGALVMLVITDVIESGTSTTLVCLAEDPRALQRSQPELFNKIRETYQTVVPPV